MASSYISISSVTYSLEFKTYSDNIEPLISESITIIDPSDYDAGNSVLVATGHKRQIVTLGGFCSIACRNAINAAITNNTKVAPYLYPNSGPYNLITTGSTYYITSFNGSGDVDSEKYYYDMEMIYGSDS